MLEGAVTCLIRYLCQIECLTNRSYLLYSVCCLPGTDVTPTAACSRLVYCLSFLSSTVLLAAYSGILISFITNQQRTIPIVDLDGLLQSGTYKFGALQNSTELTFFSVRVAISASIHWCLDYLTTMFQHQVSYLWQKLGWENGQEWCNIKNVTSSFTSSKSCPQ